MPRTKVTKSRPIPKKLAECADALYSTRQTRLQEQQVTAEMEAYEKALKQHLIDNLPKGEASGIAGKLARVSITTKEVPTVKDWDALFKWVVKTKSWDVLGRTISAVAVQARWDAGKDVPGVEAFTAVGVSVNKL